MKESWLSGGLKVGDKVYIKRQDIFHLQHRRNRNGIITHIDGAYIMVRPMWCNWEIELYPNEITLLERNGKKIPHIIKPIKPIQKQKRIRHIVKPSTARKILASLNLSKKDMAMVNKILKELDRQTNR